MLDYLSLGTTPVDEECSQVGSKDYSIKAQKECKKFTSLLRKKFGKEPKGSTFRTVICPHDFGGYYDVQIYFDEQDEIQKKYAYNVEGNKPETWKG